MSIITRIISMFTKKTNTTPGYKPLTDADYEDIHSFAKFCFKCICPMHYNCGRHNPWEIADLIGGYGLSVRVERNEVIAW